LPHVLGNANSDSEDSFSSGLLEYPHYTRPADFRGMKVPDVLLSGDHSRIAAWRRKEALKRTHERRPDLLAKASLSAEEKKILHEFNEQDTNHSSNSCKYILNSHSAYGIFTVVLKYQFKLYKRCSAVF